MFLAYFTTLKSLKNFKNGIKGFYTIQAKYLHSKLRINFPYSPPFKGSVCGELAVCMLADQLAS